MPLKDCLKCEGKGEFFNPVTGRDQTCKVCLGTGEVESDPDDERDEEFQSDEDLGYDDFDSELQCEELNN